MSQPELPQSAVDLVKRWEGWHRALPDGRAGPYMCPAGVATIGYGATFLLNGSPVTMQTPPVTRAEGEALLLAQLAIFRRGVLGLVTVPLNANQLGALTSFAFNLGLGRLRSSTMLRRLNGGDYEGAAEEFPRWNRAGGRVLPGLVARRADEQALFRRISHPQPASGTAGSRFVNQDQPLETHSGWLRHFLEAFQRSRVSTER
jgi:lysozyme